MVEETEEKESEVSEPTDNDYQDWDGSDDANDETDEEPESEDEEITEGLEIEQLITRVKYYIDAFFMEEVSNEDSAKLSQNVKEMRTNIEGDVQRWGLKDKDKLVKKLMTELISSGVALDYFSRLHGRDRKVVKGLEEQVKVMNTLKEEHTKDEETIKKLKGDIEDYFSYKEEEMKSIKETPQESGGTIKRKDIAILQYLDVNGESHFAPMSKYFKGNKEMSEPILSHHLNIVLRHLELIDIKEVKDANGKRIKTYKINDRGRDVLKSYLK